MLTSHNLTELNVHHPKYISGMKLVGARSVVFELGDVDCQDDVFSVLSHEDFTRSLRELAVHSHRELTTGQSLFKAVQRVEKLTVRPIPAPSFLTTAPSTFCRGLKHLHVTQNLSGGSFHLPLGKLSNLETFVLEDFGELGDGLFLTQEILPFLKTCRFARGYVSHSNVVSWSAFGSKVPNVAELEMDDIATFVGDELCTMILPRFFRRLVSIQFKVRFTVMPWSLIVMIKEYLERDPNGLKHVSLEYSDIGPEKISEVFLQRFQSGVSELRSDPRNVVQFVWVRDGFSFMFQRRSEV
jgi:hypothetical protein